MDPSAFITQRFASGPTADTKTICPAPPPMGVGLAVAVGGAEVAVGGTGVAVGGTRVAVGGTAVAVGGTDVAVGVLRLSLSMRVAVGGTGVAVGVGVAGVAQPITAKTRAKIRMASARCLCIFSPP